VSRGSAASTRCGPKNAIRETTTPSTHHSERGSSLRPPSHLIAGFFIGCVGAAVLLQVGAGQTLPSRSALAVLSLFGDVIERVRSSYVEVPNDESLIANAITGMVSSLDPNSRYQSAQQLAAGGKQDEDDLNGLGLALTLEKGVVRVISAVDDTPAANAGLRANDAIIAVNGQELLGDVTLQEAKEMMRGPEGSAVALSVVHDGLDKPFETRLIREKSTDSSVKSRVEGQVGYVRIAKFEATTAQKLEEAVANLQRDIGAKDLRGFVLDLRNNPAGVVDQAAAVADAFLDAGEIASTRGRSSGIQRFAAHAGDIAAGKPLIVLINGGTGAAAEVVAAALKENHRATIVGTLSFGIGSLQSVIPLGANGALILTTARYYTPAGHLIDGKGVAPDIEISEDLPPDLAASSAPVSQPKLKPTLKTDTSPARGSPGYVSPDAKDDKQLRFALDLLTGKQTNPVFPPTTPI